MPVSECASCRGRTHQAADLVTWPSLLHAGKDVAAYAVPEVALDARCKQALGHTPMVRAMHSHFVTCSRHSQAHLAGAVARA